MISQRCEMAISFAAHDLLGMGTQRRGRYLEEDVVSMALGPTCDRVCGQLGIANMSRSEHRRLQSWRK